MVPQARAGNVAKRCTRSSAPRTTSTYRLTGQITTDFSYASGTGVYDLVGWRYATEFITGQRPAREIWPEIVPSTEILGTLLPEAAEALGVERACRWCAGGWITPAWRWVPRTSAMAGFTPRLGSAAWIAVSSEKPVLDKP